MLEWRREAPDAVRIVCRDADAGLLRVGEAQYVVYSGLRRSLCAGLSVRISPGGLAVWTGGGRVVDGGSTTVVAGSLPMTSSGTGVIPRFARGSGGGWDGPEAPRKIPFDSAQDRLSPG